MSLVVTLALVGGLVPAAGFATDVPAGAAPSAQVLAVGGPAVEDDLGGPEWTPEAEVAPEPPAPEPEPEPEAGPDSTAPPAEGGDPEPEPSGDAADEGEGTGTEESPAPVSPAEPEPGEPAPESADPVFVPEEAARAALSYSVDDAGFLVVEVSGAEGPLTLRVLCEKPASGDWLEALSIYCPQARVADLGEGACAVEVDLAGDASFLLAGVVWWQASSVGVSYDGGATWEWEEPLVPGSPSLLSLGDVIYVYDAGSFGAPDMYFADALSGQRVFCIDSQKWSPGADYTISWVEGHPCSAYVEVEDAYSVAGRLSYTPYRYLSDYARQYDYLMYLAATVSETDGWFGLGSEEAFMWRLFEAAHHFVSVDGYTITDNPLVYWAQVYAESDETYADGYAVYYVPLENGNSSFLQPMVGYRTPEGTGSLVLKKRSLDERCTGGSGLYSLGGAVFELYSDEALTDLVATLTTKEAVEDGREVGYAEAEGLPVGTYWLVERSASEGFLVTVEGNDPRVEVYPGQVSTVVWDEEPVGDPSFIMVWKVDSKTGEHVPQGDASLGGARFTVDYYDGYYSSPEELAGVEPRASWVQETDEGGYTDMISGVVEGEPFRDDLGNAYIPLGTVAIYESQAPEGYAADPTVSIAWVTSDGEGGTSYDYVCGSHFVKNEYVGYEVSEEIAVLGGVEAYKVDSETGEPLAGVVFSVANASENPVVVRGETYAPGEEVERIATDASGRAATAPDYPYGTYSVTEVEVPEGYVLDGATQYAFVCEDGAWAACPEAFSDMQVYGGLSIRKVDSLTQGAPQGDATFVGAAFEVRVETEGGAVVHGVRHAKGDVVDTLVVEEGPGVSSAPDAYPAGTYSVREVAAPAGYALSEEVWTFEVAASEPGVALVEVGEDAWLGSILIEKVDADTFAHDPQGDALIEGAVFGVYNASAAAVVVEGVAYRPMTRDQVAADDGSGAMLTVSVSDGYARTPEALPMGTYLVKELSAGNDGYLVDPEIHEVVLAEPGEPAADTVPFKDPVKRLALEVQKVDADTGLPAPQGGASFEGFAFSVVNASASAVSVGGVEYQPGDEVARVEADSSGHAVVENLPWGTYGVVEVEAPFGYEINGEAVSVELRGEDGEVGAYVELADEVSRGGVAVQKTDLQSGLATPQGAGSFEGVEFVVRNETGADIVYEGRTVPAEPGEGGEGNVVCTLVADASGFAATAPDALPLGTYSVTEVASGAGYLLTDGEPHYVEVSRAGELAPEAGPETFANRAARGDMELVKVDESTMERMGGVAFLVTSETTGESHVVVTDANGRWSSASTRGADPNGNDAAWDPSTRTVDESLLDASRGVWFSGYAPAAGAEVAPDASLGSFPYDTYTFRELRTPGNAGHHTVTFTVGVYADGATVDLGTVDNRRVGISTSFADASGSKDVDAGPALLVDEVEYYGLVPGGAYTLVARVLDKTSGEVLRGEGGEELLFASGFTAASGAGTARVEVEADLTGLAGHELVCLERLYDADWELQALHEDATDEGQTVSVGCSLATQARGEVSGAAEVQDGPGRRVVDAVGVSGLRVGESYTLSATLRDAESGKAVPGAGALTFTAEARDMAVEVVLDCDLTNLAGRTLTVCETLTRESDGAEVARHDDLLDTRQQVRVVSVGTTLTCQGEKDYESLGAVELVDAVAYRGLTPGATYVLHAQLFDRGSGQAALGPDGEAAEALLEFVPESPDGVAELSLSVDLDLAGEGTYVCFETLFAAGPEGLREIAREADLFDDGQSVRLRTPIVSTELASAEGTHVAEASGTCTLTDRVSYGGLVPGKTYVLKGTLVFKDTGEPVAGEGGEAVERALEFVAESAEGFVDMEFEVDSSQLAGRTVVAFESVSREGREVCAHADLESAEQSVSVVSISTRALVASTGAQEGPAEGAIVMDEVRYTGLPAGDYTLMAELVSPDGATVAATGEAELEVGESPDGYAYVALVCPGGLPAGTYTVFETLYDADGRYVASHRDLENSPEQQVGLLRLSTTMVASDTGTHETGASGEVGLVDTVAYEGLVPGRAYTVTGTLYDRATGNPVTDVGGRAVRSEVVFTPASPDGTVEVPYELDASALAGRTVVSFESLSRDGVEVCSHADIDDAAQSVSLVSISTTALGASSGAHETPAGEGGIVDTVRFSGLTPGATYVLSASVRQHGTGYVLKVGGEPVGASVTFVANAADGEVEVPLDFDSSALAGYSTVVYETLYDADGNALASERTPDSQEQRVSFTSVSTTAVDRASGTHSGKVSGGSATIRDTVSYRGLTPQRPYVFKATVYDKATGQPLRASDGAAVSAEATVVPDAADGTAVVDVTFASSMLRDGVSTVVFEEVYDSEGHLVAFHRDIADEGQTVGWSNPGAPSGGGGGGTIPQTGVGGETYLLLAGGALALAAGAALLLPGYRRDPEFMRLEAPSRRG